jgi:hypothetical protein
MSRHPMLPKRDLRRSESRPSQQSEGSGAGVLRASIGSRCLNSSAVMDGPNRAGHNASACPSMLRKRMACTASSMGHKTVPFDRVLVVDPDRRPPASALPALVDARRTERLKLPGAVLGVAVCGYID